MRLRGPDCYECVLTHRAGHPVRVRAARDLDRNYQPDGAAHLARLADDTTLHDKGRFLAALALALVDKHDGAVRLARRT